MNKILNKIPWAIAIVLLAFVLILNIIYTVGIAEGEHAVVNNNSITTITITILIVCAILGICQILKKGLHKVKDKYFIFGALIVIYIIVQLLWINYAYIPLSADQKYAYEIAVSMKDGNMQEFMENYNDVYGNISMKTYLECYPQQFTLAFIWNILFRIFNSTNIAILMQVNVFCNAITVISTFLICKELSKKYKVNKYLAVILTLTFLPISLLCIFAYGDIPGLTFSMLGTYLIIKYVNDKKIRYAILSALSLSLACMVRTNSLIFIIAILIYLFLDMIQKEETKKTAKDIITKIVVAMGLVIIVFLPTSIVKNYYLNKSNLNKANGFPVNGWMCMGMFEGECTSRLV